MAARKSHQWKAKETEKGLYIYTLIMIISPIISASYKKHWPHMVHLSKKTRWLVLEYSKTISLLVKITSNHHSIAGRVNCSTDKPSMPCSLPYLHDLAHAHLSTWRIFSSAPSLRSHLLILKVSAQAWFFPRQLLWMPPRRKGAQCRFPHIFLCSPLPALTSPQPPDQSSERTGSRSGLSLHCQLQARCLAHRKFSTQFHKRMNE